MTAGNPGGLTINEPKQHGGPPPWINPEMQQHVAWRDQDIVISVPIKSGTTWMMNIVYQLLHAGNPDFEDTYAEVPWFDFVTRPGMPVAGRGAAGPGGADAARVTTCVYDARRPADLTVCGARPGSGRTLYRRLPKSGRVTRVGQTVPGEAHGPVVRAVADAERWASSPW